MDQKKTTESRIEYKPKKQGMEKVSGSLRSEIMELGWVCYQINCEKNTKIKGDLKC